MKVFSISIEIKNKGGFILVNYVKFMRGPKSAFTARYNETNKPDRDTLYFLTDNETGQTELWLGESLISSGDAMDALSPAAQDYLNQITACINNEVTPLNTGDFLVYNAENNTWEPSTVVVGNFQGATENSNGVPGLVPGPTIAEKNSYLRGDGTWADLTSEILPQVLSSIVGDSEEDKINSDFDTLKEISDWIINHPSNATEINTRLTDLEDAIGTGRTETIYTENVLKENEDNLFWYFEEEPNTTLQKTPYPAYIIDPELGWPEYFQLTDIEENKLYWDITEQPETVKQDSIYVAIILETSIQQLPNEIEIIKKVIGHLEPQDNIYPQIINQEVGTLTDRLSTIETNFNAVTKTVISGGSNKIILKDVGDLSQLTIKKEDDISPINIVDAINTLDKRMQWQELEQQQQNP